MKVHLLYCATAYNGNILYTYTHVHMYFIQCQVQLWLQAVKCSSGFGRAAGMVLQPRIFSADGDDGIRDASYTRDLQVKNSVLQTL